MTLHLFDDVFLLNLSLEAAKGVLQSFALLKLDFSQLNTPPYLTRLTKPSRQLFLRLHRQLVRMDPKKPR